MRRFLKDNEFPKELTPAALKAAVKKGTITIADVVAYMQDANRDLTAQTSNQAMDWNVGNLNTGNRQQAGLQNMLQAKDNS